MNEEASCDQTRRCFMSGIECHKYSNNFTFNDPQRAFVIMPFKAEFFDIYEFGIKSALKEEGIDVVNGRDSYFMSGEYIICNICEEINRAGLVIADISVGNPNVYYEFGLALALRKKCIVLHKSYTKFPTRFRNLLSSPGCIPKEYDSISEIRDCLSSSLRTLQSYEPPKKMSVLVEEQCHLTAIIAENVIENRDDESGLKTHQRHVPNYKDLFDYGIKEKLNSLDEQLPRSLTDLRKGNDIPNIADCEENIDSIISKLMTCRYCIVDVHEKALVAYFWMGFIHGLGVNDKVNMRPDLSFLYISADPDMSKLPFDIQAVRVENYTSIGHASTIVVNEIIQREVEKLNRFNRERCKFWKKMSLANTKFLIGALDVYLSKEEKRYRSKVSLQDFKTFDMIAYLLMLGQKTAFEYDRHFVRVSDYLDDPSDPNDTQEMSKSPIKTNPNGLPDLVREGPDTPVTIIGDDEPLAQGRRDYVVMIGSSCANPATQMLLNLLYSDSDSFRFYSTKKHKARADAWYHVEDPNDYNVGIFVNVETLENQRGGALGKSEIIGDLNDGKFKQCANSGYPIGNDVEIKRDAGLLVVTNDWPENDEDPPKQTIVLSGFRKLGTYFMAYLLAHYSCLGKSGNVSKRRGRPLLIRTLDTKGKQQEKEVRDSDFLAVLNDEIERAKTNSVRQKSNYCIEAIFEFKADSRESTSKNKNSVWHMCLTEFFLFNREQKMRNSILDKVQKHAKNRILEEDVVD